MSDIYYFILKIYDKILIILIILIIYINIIIIMLLHGAEVGLPLAAILHYEVMKLLNLQSIFHGRSH